MRCCAKVGLTLEITELNYQENYALGMYHLKHDRTFTRVDFSSIFEHQNIATMKVGLNKRQRNNTLELRVAITTLCSVTIVTCKVILSELYCP